ncbi:MAG: formamidopyrimidine-DNA glycosylase [Rhodospirillaceae bacterium]|nr:MAG: formamidopyrimidine-DNA glycosylase [Rhodospirillaceae bacterium]
MPELPEVETVRRGLEQVWPGRVFSRVLVRRSDLRRPLPPHFAHHLEGCRIESVTRRAKYLLITLQANQVMLMHLGMSGRLQIARADGTAPGPHDHVIFQTDEGTVVSFRDPRRFGLMDLCSATALATHPLLVRLGPEPLDPAFDGQTLAKALAKRKGPVKTALLDQHLVAGLGNIYACEALYRAGLAPDRRADSITGPAAETLVQAIRTVLNEAIAAGGSTLRDYVRPDGQEGYFQHAFAVYGREGQACGACDCNGRGRVVRVVQSGRSTFFCPEKQV